MHHTEERNRRRAVISFDHGGSTSCTLSEQDSAAYASWEPAESRVR